MPNIKLDWETIKLLTEKGVNCEDFLLTDLDFYEQYEKDYQLIKKGSTHQKIRFAFDGYYLYVYGNIGGVKRRLKQLGFKRDKTSDNKWYKEVKSINEILFLRSLIKKEVKI